MADHIVMFHCVYKNWICTQFDFCIVVTTYSPKLWLHSIILYTFIFGVAFTQIFEFLGIFHDYL